MKISSSAIYMVSAIAALFVSQNAYAETASVPDSYSNIPRFYGTLSGKTLDSMTYKPNCPNFVFDIDAVAIQESNSKAFVQEQERKFPLLQRKWEAYEDCMIENTRRDGALLKDLVSKYIEDTSKIEADNFQATNSAVKPNYERLKNQPIKKEKQKSNDAADKAVFSSNWVKPEGRKIGVLTEGSVDKVTYTNSCPVYTGEISAQNLNDAKTATRFNELYEALKLVPDKIEQARDCRYENVNFDYEIITKILNKGLDVAYQPENIKYQTKYRAVRDQLNLQRQAGGLLVGTARKKSK